SEDRKRGLLFAVALRRNRDAGERERLEAVAIQHIRLLRRALALPFVPARGGHETAARACGVSKCRGREHRLGSRVDPRALRPGRLKTPDAELRNEPAVPMAD